MRAICVRRWDGWRRERDGIELYMNNDGKHEREAIKIGRGKRER